jgi:hypothetical protein
MCSKKWRDICVQKPEEGSRLVIIATVIAQWSPAPTQPFPVIPLECMNMQDKVGRISFQEY